MSSIRDNPRPVRCNGTTLVELLVALTVVAMLSTTVTILLSAASKTNSFINSQGDAASQVEIAYRRIMHNVRMASALLTPADTTPGGVLQIQTQPDPNNSNQSWTVTYKIVNGNLVEDDPRYNTGNTPNTLIRGVGTFTVVRSATSGPTTIQITIISNSQQPITRSLTIDCRNF